MDSLGSFSKRRTYSKSPNGCRECKIRKVKCDEVHPICGKCKVHFKNPKPCTWSPSPVAASSRLASSSRPARRISPIPPSLSPDTSPLGATNLTFPLRLFHHFATELNYQLPHSHKPACRDAWRYGIAELCFDAVHDYPLNIILAASAVHIYKTRAPDNDDMLLAGRIYFDRGLQGFQQSLQNEEIGSSNAAAIMVSAGIMPILGEVFVDRQGDSYVPPLFRFRMAKAIKELVAKSAPFLGGTPLAAFMSPYDQDTERLPRYIYLKAEEKASLTGLLNDLEPGSSNYDIYQEALELISLAQEAASTGSTQPALLFAWTSFNLQMSDGFMSLLEQHDPRAFVIWAHHLAMAKFLDAWWNSDTAEYNVPGLLSLLPDEWRPLMQWPIYITNRKESPRVAQSMRMLTLDEITVD